MPQLIRSPPANLARARSALIGIIGTQPSKSPASEAASVTPLPGTRETGPGRRLRASGKCSGTSSSMRPRIIRWLDRWASTDMTRDRHRQPAIARETHRFSDRLPDTAPPASEVPSPPRDRPCPARREARQDESPLFPAAFTGLNLLVAAIILLEYDLPAARRRSPTQTRGAHPAPGDLAHLSPLDWERINLTGPMYWN